MGKKPPKPSYSDLEAENQQLQAILMSVTQKGANDDQWAAQFNKAYNKGVYDQAAIDNQRFRVMDDLAEAEGDLIYAITNFDIWVLASGGGNALIEAIAKYGIQIAICYRQLDEKAKHYNQDTSDLFSMRVKQVNERVEAIRVFSQEAVFSQEGYNRLRDLALAQGDIYRLSIYEAQLEDIQNLTPRK